MMKISTVKDLVRKLRVPEMAEYLENLSRRELNELEGYKRLRYEIYESFEVCEGKRSRCDLLDYYRKFFAIKDFVEANTTNPLKVIEFFNKESGASALDLADDLVFEFLGRYDEGLFAGIKLIAKECGYPFELEMRTRDGWVELLPRFGRRPRNVLEKGIDDFLSHVDKLPNDLKRFEKLTVERTRYLESNPHLYGTWCHPFLRLVDFEIERYRRRDGEDPAGEAEEKKSMRASHLQVIALLDRFMPELKGVNNTVKGDFVEFLTGLSSEKSRQEWSRYHVSETKAAFRAMELPDAWLKRFETGRDG